MNDKTDENINFFGLEVELWRIGDSDVAPKFNLASKPNDWIKTVQATRHQFETSDDLTEIQQLQLNDILAYLAAADTTQFPLTWEICLDFLAKLGLKIQVIAIPDNR